MQLVREEEKPVDNQEVGDLYQTEAVMFSPPCRERPLRLLGLTAAAQFNELPRLCGRGRWANLQTQKEDRECTLSSYVMAC